MGGRGKRYAVTRDGTPLAYGAVVEAWQSDAAFRSFFIDLLASSSFPAFRWETPPLTRASVQQPFEFALVRAPEIDLPADPSPFVSHLASGGGERVVSFENLGGDALLVVPCAMPDVEPGAYAHLAPFLRTAPSEQTHALWQDVGRAVSECLGDRPLWLNTAGGGVAWLHVRLDARPKYYAYRPFREMTGQ